MLNIDINNSLSYILAHQMLQILIKMLLKMRSNVLEELESEIIRSQVCIHDYIMELNNSY